MHEGRNRKMRQRESWRSRWATSVLGAVLLLVLVGCEGGSTPPGGDDTTSPTSAQGAPAPAEDDTAAPSTVAVLSEPVSMTTTTALTPARRLEVTGHTNLPDRTRLFVELERRVSGVSWQARTEVDGGGFAVGPLGPGSGLVAGHYLIRVSMPAADVQPPPVKRRIGTRGEHLTGPLVARSPHGLGNVIDYRRDYLFDE